MIRENFQQQLAKLWPQMDNCKLDQYAPQLRQITDQAISQINQGDLPKWLQTWHSLPELKPQQIDLDQAAVTAIGDAKEQKQQLKDKLQALHPWRKGPFQLFDIFIDSEWQSNRKWQRLAPHLPKLTAKTILDIGCGNGYYLLRMAAQNPALLLGIEPGLLQNIQFWAINKYINSKAAILPLKIQQLPNHMPCFDIVFSMGILYHRKSPIEHLEHLKNLLDNNGTLILETLVIDGDEHNCLVPQDRYAQMRNVWFLPSAKMLCLWLRRIGMQNVQLIDCSITTTAEQRSTEWMRFHSLPQFINPTTGQTIENHPPPQRAIIKAQK